MTLMVGTAGWSIPRALAAAFAGDGTHLARYARVLPCAEINSSFYRPHAYKTYQRWAALTPDGFRFSVKMPKSITHVQRLQQPRAPLTEFIQQIAGLGAKLGPLLVQLPPSLQYEPRVAGTFFTMLRELHAGGVACEPRHASWFEPKVAALFKEHHITRVIADPPPKGAPSYQDKLQVKKPSAGLVAYYRLHGAPRMYWSRYTAKQIATLHDHIASLPARAEVWCVFDNTASGAAIENALKLRDL